MKEDILNSFNRVLEEIQVLNKILKEQKADKVELQESLKLAQNLLFSSYSNLNLFSEYVKNYIYLNHKTKPFDKKEGTRKSNLEVKSIYNELVNLVSPDIHKGIKDLEENLILKNQADYLGLFITSPRIKRGVEILNKKLDINSLSKSDLSKTLEIYLAAIVSYIQEILFYNLFFIFDKPKVEYTNEIKFTTDYEKEYINKWIDCSVTFSDLRRNCRVDHWAGIYKLDLELDKIDKIGIHQKKIFDAYLETKIKSALNDFSDLEPDSKSKVLNKEVKLIQDFFYNNTSKEVVGRLKNILSFQKPKEVLLEYDNLLRSRLSLEDFNIYEIGKANFSPIFVAFFFKKYLERLKESLESNEIYVLFDAIRSTAHTDLQLYNIIKEHTQLDKDALQYFYKDTEVYLVNKKGSFQNFQSSESDLSLMVDAIPINVFNLETKEVDLDCSPSKEEEQFFSSIYQLQSLINKELGKIQEKEEPINPQTQSKNKLKVDLSVPELSLLFKMINDLKPTIFNTKSDADLFRFISTNYQTKKSSEKGISTQKLRNEFNNPDLKAIEFWEKHLHTMLSNIRKLK